MTMGKRVRTVETFHASLAEQVALKRIALRLGDCQFTLCVSGLPWYATEADMEDFFGMLLEVYMNARLNGTKPKNCYVQFDNEELALKALEEKDNGVVLGQKVRVEVSSVSLQQLTQRKACLTIRQLPYGLRQQNEWIETAIREEYGSDVVSQVVVRECCQEKEWGYRYALVTFSGPVPAEEAMRSHANYLANLEPGEKMKLKELRIEDYMEASLKHKHWFTKEVITDDKGEASSS